MEHKRLDGFAEGDDLCRVDVVADGELSHGNHTLGLVADVKKHLIAVDLDDLPLDKVAVVELDDGGDHRAVELWGTEIVFDDDAGNVVTFCVEGTHRLGREGGEQVSHIQLTSWGDRAGICS